MLADVIQPCLKGYIVPFPVSVPGEVRYICPCVCRQGMRPSVTRSNAIIAGLNIYVTIRIVTELK